MSENRQKDDENSTLPIKGLIGDNLSPNSQSSNENETNNSTQLPDLRQSILKSSDEMKTEDENKELPPLKQNEINQNENQNNQNDDQNHQSDADYQQPVSVTIEMNDKNEVSIDKTEEKMNNHSENDFVINQENQQKTNDNEFYGDKCDSQLQSNSMLDESADETQKNDQTTTTPISDIIKDNLMDNNNKEEHNNDENNEQENTDNQMNDLKPLSRTTPRHNQSKRSVTSYSTPASPQKRGQTALLGKKEFIAMIKRKPYGRTLSVQPKDMKPQQSSVDISQIPGMADNLLKGRNLPTSDPLAICDVIDELIGRKVEALDKDDYVQCHKIDEAINKARIRYRMADRETIHNTLISRLEQKKKDMEQQIQDSKKEWKQKWNELETKQQEERDKLYQEHVQQHEDLDYFWTDPNNYHKFNKRTPTQLNHIAIERSLAMTGRFLEAEEWRKMNEKNEKLEIKEQIRRLEQKYEAERANLIYFQNSAAKSILGQQERQRNLLAEREKKDMDIKQKKLENIQRHLEEEKNFNNFCAKTYKRDPSYVLPPTVTTISPWGATDDIPAIPPGKSIPRGVEETMKIHQKPRTQPFNLPALKLKKYKVPRIGEQPKPKKKEE